MFRSYRLCRGSANLLEFCDVLSRIHLLDVLRLNMCERLQAVRSEVGIVAQVREELRNCRTMFSDHVFDLAIQPTADDTFAKDPAKKILLIESREHQGCRDGAGVVEQVQ